MDNGQQVSDKLFLNLLLAFTEINLFDRFLHSYRNQLLLFPQKGLGQNLLDDLELNDNHMYVPNENIS